MTEARHFLELNAKETGLVVFALATMFCVAEREEEAATVASLQFLQLLSMTPPEVVSGLINKLNPFTEQLIQELAQQPHSDQRDPFEEEPDATPTG